MFCSFRPHRADAWSNAKGIENIRRRAERLEAGLEPELFDARIPERLRDLPQGKQIVGLRGVATRQTPRTVAAVRDDGPIGSPHSFLGFFEEHVANSRNYGLRKTSQGRSLNNKQSMIARCGERVMELENSGMTYSLKSRVVAITSATSAYGEAIAKLILSDDGRLALGAPSAQFPMLDARIDGRDGVHCQPIDLDRPKSTSEFFQIAYAQFGRLDVVVLEAVASKAKRVTAEKQVELGTRRLLYCLDAALPYVGEDLHFICISPAYGPAAIPIATAFLGAKLSAMRDRKVPSIRMSIVSPPTASPSDVLSFARTIVHLMREPRIPDIIETVLSPRRKARRQDAKRLIEAQGKINAQA